MPANARTPTTAPAAIPAVFEPPPPPDALLVEDASGSADGVIVTTRVCPGEMFVTTDGVAVVFVEDSDELDDPPPATGTPESPLVRYTL